MMNRSCRHSQRATVHQQGQFTPPHTVSAAISGQRRDRDSNPSYRHHLRCTMPHTLNLGAIDSYQSKPFSDLLSEVNRIGADTKKLQCIHQNVCAELAHRLSVPDSCSNPNYRNISHLELLVILRSVFKKIMEISSRERTILHQAQYVTQILE